MAKDEVTEPLLKISCDDGAWVKSFNTIDEFKAWAVSEKEFWATLKVDGPAARLVEPFRTDIDLGNAVAAVRGGDGDVNGQELENLQRRLNNLISAKRLIPTDSRLGQLIGSLHESDPAMAVYIAALHENSLGVFGDSLQVVGGEARRKLNLDMALKANANLQLFEFGLLNHEVEANALRTMRTSWNDQFMQQANSIRSEFGLLREEYENLQKLIRHSAQEARAQEESHDERMADIEKRYREDMSLRGPVEYWKKKHDEHELEVPYWGKAAAVTFTAGVLLLLLVISCSDPAASIRELAEKTNLSPEQASAAYTQSWLTLGARVAVLALLFAWPVRIFVRNYMSHQHLTTDAAERVVAMETYLAMRSDPDLKDDSAVRNQALSALLDRVFRQASDGIVKDDGAPTESILAAMKNFKP